MFARTIKHYSTSAGENKWEKQKRRIFLNFVKKSAKFFNCFTNDRNFHQYPRNLFFIRFKGICPKFLLNFICCLKLLFIIKVLFLKSITSAVFIATGIMSLTQITGICMWKGYWKWTGLNLSPTRIMCYSKKMSWLKRMASPIPYLLPIKKDFWKN